MLYARKSRHHTQCSVQNDLADCSIANTNNIFFIKKQRELLAHAALVIKLQLFGFGFLRSSFFSYRLCFVSIFFFFLPATTNYAYTQLRCGEAVLLAQLTHQLQVIILAYFKKFFLFVSKCLFLCWNFLQSLLRGCHFLQPAFTNAVSTASTSPFHFATSPA